LVGALAIARCAYAGPVVEANLIPVPIPMADVLNAFAPDKVSINAVFAKYGQNAWPSSGAASYGIGPQFIGIDSGNVGDTLGGIDSECVLGECAYFGARASVGGHVKAGAAYGFTVGGGSLDIRYPVSVTLDLPYGPNGTNVPKVGEPFTIGSTWSVNTAKVLSKPGTASALAPLFAAHGPTLQAFVELVGELEAYATGRLCVVWCLGGTLFEEDVGGTYEIAINRGGDGEVRVFNQAASPGKPGELLGGVIQYYLNVPTLDAKGTLGADQRTFTAQTADQVLGIGVGIDELLSMIFGLPPLSDTWGVTIAGKHLGVGYNILEADAWLDLYITQQLGFVGNPVIDLEFSGDVRMRQPDGTFGAPTKTVSFNAGDSIDLVAVDSQVLGVVPTVRLFGVASNKADLELGGNVSLSALGLTSSLGPIGPLVPTQTKSFDVGSTEIADKSFVVEFAPLVGGAFNMFFLPPDGPVTQIPQKDIAIAFWDTAQWNQADTGCAGVLDCGFLPQSMVVGFYGLAEGDPFLGCLQRGGQCDPDNLFARLDFDRFRDRFFLTGTRFFGEDGLEVFLTDLLALDDPLLDVQPDVTAEDIERSRAALQLAFGPQPFIVPAAPVPEPGSVALLGLSLAAILLARRRGLVARR
jgi:hypothetical protein